MLEELRISSLLCLSEMKLAIPYEYQRPYVWHEKSVRQLFYDTYNAFKNNLTEYRLGTIILHRDKDEDNNDIYNVVDGQQRLVILYLLLYALYKNSSYKLYRTYFFTYFYLFIKLFCQL